MSARDRTVSAAFLAQLLELTVGDPVGPFLPVRINSDLTFDFDDRHPFHSGHYAFLVDDATFDAVLARLQLDSAIDYGSGPENGWDRQINPCPYSPISTRTDSASWPRTRHCAPLRQVPWSSVVASQQAI